MNLQTNNLHLDVVNTDGNGTLNVVWVLTCKIPGSKSAKCLRRGALSSLASTNAAAALADKVLI